MTVSEQPIIPKDIVVHLGNPDDPNVENITVPFPEYVKNVASSEIYPTWPDSSIDANLYVIINYALNRIYTEWYRNQGYDFDITNSTAFDQAFVKDRDVFRNISIKSDELFNNYIRKEGSIEPYFTSFCDGVKVKCDGLSQWGTVPLAEEGKSALDILKNYYGDDIEIVENAPVSEDTESYPGTILRLGDIGNDVATIEVKLNRIGKNYPAIPQVEEDGVYGPKTEEAVKTFQKIFNLNPDGIVGKSTWYKINYIYTAVKELGELTSEGISVTDLYRPFADKLQLGSYGIEVKTLQYYLDFISFYNDNIDPVTIDGIFGEKTENAVKQFQKEYGLEVNGIVDLKNFRKLEEVYDDIYSSIPPETMSEYVDIYPGYVLFLGLSNPKVTLIQQYLKLISENTDYVSPVKVTGVYDNQTDKAVRQIQDRFAIPITGTVDPATWYQIIQLKDSFQEE
ncbi:peptidoglycan-binding protein [Sedimentibacter sp. zth1]|uniref:peptidoglycan-binding domain-containing protein n=1 Tax=Sedimentibacter sp. zth1 TaxID=2816908 RepID=UPI001A91D105|nr:peptidoglycan-binding protein [Sedimentibacter sp. zth1]QSX04756.1 peptidoglycan-binding protein [Sedimentibacter sp. zth1]